MLSLVLPLCCNLTLLNLSCNAIGDKGMVAFAEALSSLEKLETLLMSSNEIGDPGASRFAGAITDGALAESLKKLDLGNNHIGDKGALTLASAISGGAIYQCKSVNLKGNPMSPAGDTLVGALAWSTAYRPSWPMEWRVEIAVRAAGLSVGSADAVPTAALGELVRSL